MPGFGRQFGVALLDGRRQRFRGQRRDERRACDSRRRSAVSMPNAENAPAQPGSRPCGRRVRGRRRPRAAARAAVGDEHEIARVEAAFGRHRAHGVRHRAPSRSRRCPGAACDVESSGSATRSHARSAAAARRDGCGRRRSVAAERRPRTRCGVGDRGRRAAAAVTGRSRSARRRSRGPTCRPPASSIHAMLPPPVPTSLMSSTGMRIDETFVVAADEVVGRERSRRRLAARRPLPSCRPCRSRSGRRCRATSPDVVAPTTPPAGPDSSIWMHCSRAVATSHSPPLDCMISRFPAKPSLCAGARSRPLEIACSRAVRRRRSRRSSTCVRIRGTRAKRSCDAVTKSAGRPLEQELAHALFVIDVGVRMQEHDRDRFDAVGAEIPGHARARPHRRTASRPMPS